METTTITNSTSGSTEISAIILNQIRFLMYNVFIPTVSIAGMLGNGLNIIVLTRSWMRSSTNHYLTALACYDIAYLLCVLLITRLGKVTEVVWLLRPLADTCSNTGVWLTVTFTIERYIGVCHPMRGRSLCTPQRAIYVVMAVCAGGAILTAPEFFHSSLTGRTSYDTGYMTLLQTLFTFVPLTLLIVFNYFLVRSVVRASMERTKMCYDINKSRTSRQAAEQHRVTTMLITVVLVFLVCQLPQAIVNSLRLNPHNNTVLIVNNCVNFLVIINAAVNFILYSVMSSKFRRTFTHLLVVVRYRLCGHSDLTGYSDDGPPFPVALVYGQALNKRHSSSASYAHLSAAAHANLLRNNARNNSTTSMATSKYNPQRRVTSPLVSASNSRDGAVETSTDSDYLLKRPDGGVVRRTPANSPQRIIISVLAPSPDEDRLISRDVIVTRPIIMRNGSFR